MKKNASIWHKVLTVILAVIMIISSSISGTSVTRAAESEGMPAFQTQSGETPGETADGETGELPDGAEYAAEPGSEKSDESLRAQSANVPADSSLEEDIPSADTPTGDNQATDLDVQTVPVNNDNNPDSTGNMEGGSEKDEATQTDKNAEDEDANSSDNNNDDSVIDPKEESGASVHKENNLYQGMLFGAPANNTDAAAEAIADASKTDPNEDTIPLDEARFLSKGMFRALAAATPKMVLT